MKFEKYTIYYDKKGYPIIWVGGKNVKLHIYIWEKKYGEKPKGYQLHHKDFDNKNYALFNLELVTQSDHLRLHARWKKTKGKWSHKPCNGCKKLLPLIEFYPRKNLPPSALCKRCHNIQVSKRRTDPIWKEKNRLYQKEWARKRRLELSLSSAE